MQLPSAFDATQIDPSQGGGMLPIGKHLVIVESSEVKATKANDGGFLQLDLKIIEGPQTGLTGAYRLNLFNANEKAVAVAQRQMSALCHVTGVFQVTDSQQLHNIPFMVEVVPQQNKPEYTEVKRVFDANGNEPGKAGQAPAQPAPAQAPAPQGQWGASQAPAQPQAQAQAQAPVTASAPWGQPQTPQAQAPQQASVAPTGNPPWGQPQG
jgi:hypothetical protein